MKDNPGYKPFHKKRVVIWVANIKDIMFSKSGLTICSEEEAGNRIARLKEGVLVGMSAGCFEGDEWDHKPKIGDAVFFGGYSGATYQNGDNFYRIMEDKFLETPQLKS